MIEATHIFKLYKIPHEKRVTLFETILGYIKNQISHEDFYALRDISFSISQGEIIGLIGKNGSGKTTLLEILSGIIAPTSGTYHIQGTVAPLLGLSVGFHHELTAQENLYLYGAIIGIPRKKIKENIHHVLHFAGVERFKDMKLKHFSSGMIARLAFAAMVQSDPDVLLLDEIFAVGDKDFKPQCLSVFDEYKKRGKTIILASHDLEVVRNYCGRTILLDGGRLVSFDETSKVLASYKNL